MVEPYAECASEYAALAASLDWCVTEHLQTAELLGDRQQAAQVAEATAHAMAALTALRRAALRGARHG